MSAWDPVCTIVASSTAGRVHASTRADCADRSRRGDEDGEGTAFSNEEVVGDDGPRRAGRRHTLRVKGGGEFPECTLEPGAEVAQANRLADGSGLQGRLATVLHGQCGRRALEQPA